MIANSLKHDLRSLESLYLEIQDIDIAQLNSISQDLGIELKQTTSIIELRETVRQKLKYKIGMAQNANAVTMAQQAMWFLYKLNPASTANTLKHVFRVPPKTNPEILKKAIEAVILNHEILRTTYSDFDGTIIKVIQIVNQEPLYSFEIIESSEWENILQGLLSSPINIATGPIFKIYYFILKDGKDVCAIHFHHIIGDLITLELLQLNIWKYYKKIKKNDSFLLNIEQNELILSALSERRYLNSAIGKLDREYWKKKLVGDIQPFNVLAEKTSPKSNLFNGQIHPSKIDHLTSSQVIKFSKTSGITPYRLFLSVLYVLLYRYSNQTDLIVGSPVSTRRHQVNPEAMGYFVNMLPFRIDVAPSDSFLDIITKVNTTIKEDLNHSRYPFSQMVSDSNIERNYNKNPIFNVSLTYERPLFLESKGILNLYLGGKDENVTFNDIELGSIPFYFLDRQFDLSMYIEQIDDKFHLWTLFDVEIFSELTIQMFATHFETLTKLVLSNPDTVIGSLNYLGVEEQNKLLNIWNKADLPVYPSKTLVQIFEKQVEERPRGIALTFESRQVTYKELNSNSNKLAKKLKNNGIIIGDLIPLCFDPRPEMMVSIMGVLKSGAAYVPINPAYPQTRIESIIEDVKPKIIITEKKYSSLFESFQGNLFLIDDFNLLETNLNEPNLNEKIYPEDTAYIIYTSGSTGIPKGVMVSHQNVSRLFSSTDDWFHFTHEDVWSLFHSFAFDFSVWEIFGAILYGGRLVIIPYHTTRNPDQVLNLLEQEKITVLNQTPTAFGQLSQTIMQQLHTNIFSLRYIIFGGEALNINSLKPWFTRFGDQKPRLINMYGITETTVHVTYRPIKKEDCINDSGSLIGVPLPDLQLYILGESLNLLPVGWVGEIYVGGAGLAKGYFNRKELTEERFIYCNLNGKESQRLYKSGDLARFLSNGDIEYIGRKDNQVKIRGFRIELGDIEANLIEHPFVEKALATVDQTQKDIKNIKAYIVLKENVKITALELKQFLKIKLPDYMVPAFFIQIPDIPLTVNNKADFKQMEKIGIKLNFPVLESEEINNDIGRNIKTIWQEILNIDKIGQQSNFFELGGNSSSIIQVYNKLTTKFFYKLEVADLFRFPTILALTDYISKSQVSLNSEKTDDDFTKQLVMQSDVRLNQRLLNIRKKQDRRIRNEQ